MNQLMELLIECKGRFWTFTILNSLFSISSKLRILLKSARDSTGGQQFSEIALKSIQVVLSSFSYPVTAALPADLSGHPWQHIPVFQHPAIFHCIRPSHYCPVAGIWGAALHAPAGAGRGELYRCGQEPGPCGILQPKEVWTALPHAFSIL